MIDCRAAVTGPTITYASPPSILQEAQDIVNGARQDMYGSPEDSFDVIAGLWSSYLEHPITPQDATMMMILLKVARQKRKPKRDNLVDLAGYAECAQRVVDREARRAAAQQAKDKTEDKTEDETSA